MNVIDYITITCNRENVRLHITFDYMKNVIDYITITCDRENVRLHITFDYMKNVIDYNRLRLQITITPCLA